MYKNIYINNIFNKLSKYLKKKYISKLIILLDKNTKKYCLKYLLNNINFVKIKIIVIKNGEKNKNIYTCIKIWKKLIIYNIDKNSIIINLGGGVITDIGGFIASLFKRGLKFINIPTTFLGMIDASIGGKNGINFYNYKNEIGIIKNPIMILIDFNYLKTLPKNEILSGLGELLKYGLIYNKKLWNILKKINFNNYKNIPWKLIIKKAILIKTKIVDKDPEELLGLRKILNFGHTIGHAIESFFLYKKKKITHGEAISLGMICESWISKKINNLKKKEYKDIYKTILKYYKIRKIYKKNFNKIYNFIKNDKKNYNNNIYFSLLEKIGKCSYNKKVNKKLILMSIEKMNNINEQNKKY
ncbi:3-dehydroquinate synthase [Candidatus Shikimatogenerans bostrichidophilus]|uniref:3-dehydroquinate synthase n=1 Tax=Candidatus Shikimatogenerans bostrichidophilus TaxID=2943807 RepID=UPI002965FC7A